MDLNRHIFKGLLFDKDGTLFDFTKTWATCTRSILTRIANTPEQLDQMAAVVGFDMPTTRFAPDSIVIAHTAREIAQILQPLADDLPIESIMQIFDDEAARAVQIEAVPLAPFLMGLRRQGYRLGVATNDNEIPAHTHLNSVGIGDMFDFVAGADSGHGFKPGPGQLLAFADRMQLAPGACVMIGDSTHDLSAGRAAGFATVGVLTGGATEQDLTALADVVLPDIGQLPDWLARAV